MLGHGKKKEKRKKKCFHLLAHIYRYAILKYLGLLEFGHFLTGLQNASRLKQVDGKHIAVPIDSLDLEFCLAGPWYLHPEASDFIGYFEKCVCSNGNSCEHQDSFRVSMFTRVTAQGWVRWSSLERCEQP